ncbi:putative ribonuclease H-like domain-containing protein, partial [Tanacetum coccineum]
EKGIRREYSIARTPQRNGVAERRNRTLIETARTMVLVVKPHNKTPYELFRGFKPALSFMRPFGCHVTILNTLDNLGKFDGKSNEGFFVGYSLSSKAFRVYNTRTRRVEENLHIRFLKNKTMIEGNGPKWLFDIDSLTQSMNYVPAAAGTITNESADASYFDSPSKDVGNGEPKSAADDQKQVEDGPNNENDEKDKSEDDSSPKEVNTAGQHVNTASPEVNTGRFKLNTVHPSVNTASSYDPDSPKYMFKMGASHTLEATYVEFFSDEDEPEVDLGNILNSYTVPTTPNTRIHKDHPIKNMIGDVKSSVQTRRMTKPTSKPGFLSAVYKEKSHDTLNTCLYAYFLSQIEPTSIAKALSDSSWRAIGTKWVFRNKKDERGIVIRSKARLVSQGHRQEEGIDYKDVFALVARIEAIRLFLAYASYMGFLVYQIDVKSAFLYGTIEEEELYTAFEKLIKDKFQMSSMGELTFFLGLQVQQKEDGIFISQDKYVDEILKKFNYTDVKSASTPVDLEKPLVKDGDANDVDVHLYRSMIGSLMYLIASRPDIIYLKGKPTLGLWYSRDSPFELVAYTDSDYAGATQDRKSTTRGCQFLGNMLISWQCKKQTVVATSTTEYVAAASCYLLTKGFDAGRISTASQKEVGTLRYLSLVVPLKKVGDEAVHKELGDRMERAATTASSLEAEQESDQGKRVKTITEASIRRHLQLEDSDGISTLPTIEIFEQLALMGVHLLGRDKGSLSLHELTDLCTSLSKKVASFESELKQTKQTYNAALTKLINRVKKLKQTIKTSQARRRAKVVISDDEEAEVDPSNQGRREVDDTQISDQPEEQLGVFSTATALADAPRRRQSVENVQTYTRRRRREVSTGSGGVSTAESSTASELDSTAGVKAKDKGKAIMHESEPPKKIKKRV